MNLRLPLMLAFSGGSRRSGGGGRSPDDQRRRGGGGDDPPPQGPQQGPAVPWPDRRSREPRREDDLDEQQLRGWSFWAKVMFVHRAKLIIFSGFASGALGYLGATVGLQKRVSNLESITTSTAERVSNLEDAEPLKLYILCVLLREEHPNLVPPQCGAVDTPPMTPIKPRKPL